MIQQPTTPSRRLVFPALSQGLGAVALALSALSGGAWAAQQACTPQAGFNTCVRYTYSGGPQTFTVPNGVTSIRVTMWGAGGGGAVYSNSDTSYGGGGGGYADGAANVTPGEALTVTVGEGGKVRSVSSTYGRGGAGGIGNPAGSSGGGMSALWKGVAEFTAGSALLIAGGGGGSSANFAISSVYTGGSSEKAVPGKAVAGGGGGLSGGGSSPTSTSSFMTGGGGGTQTGGGAAGRRYSGGYETVNNGVTSATTCKNYADTAPGKQFQGGTGCANGVSGDIDEAGGGGGGGWYGGGGGMAQCANSPTTKCSYNGPGGGGSGYDGTSNSATLSPGADAVLNNSTNSAPPGNPSNALRTDTTVGVGGNASGNGTAGGNGLVVIQYNVVTTLQLAKAWGANSVPGDVASIGATSSSGNNTAAFTATAPNPGDSGTPVVVATGIAITLPAETMTTGTLTNYNTDLSCTADGGLMASSLTSHNGQQTNALTIATDDLGKAIVCTYTNTPKPVASVQISKHAVGGTGSFAFGGDNGFGTDRIEVATDGETVAGALKTLAAANVQTTLSELPTPGFRLTDVSCTGLSASAAPVVNLAAGTVTLPADGLAPGAVVACTFTNSVEATVSGRVFLDTGTGAAGVANDGVLNGDEAGLAIVDVRLTDCGSTVYASTQTDGTGAYTLAVPAAVNAGAALCVEKFNPPALLSTGASGGSVALPSHVSTMTAGTAYLYTRDATPDRIQFNWDGLSHAGLNFGVVGPGTFTANGAKTGLPGNTVSYGHAFVAGTGGSVSFSIHDAMATPGQPGWSEKIFADPACSGSLQVGAALLYPPPVALTVTAGQMVCVVVEEFIPATAQMGDTHTAQAQASFTLSHSVPAPELSVSYTLEDVTTVSTSALELTKEVRNVTRGVTSFGVSNQARSDETLEYRITYTNNGPSPIGHLTVNDVTPAYTTFVSSEAGATPAALGTCAKNTPANSPPAPAVECNAAQSTGGTGALSWMFSGTLNPGETGNVLFQVKVD